MVYGRRGASKCTEARYHIPLLDNSVDVIISNCVINLSAGKNQILRETFRVPKPGGRFAVSDVVTRGQVPEELPRDMLLWVGCIAGALDEDEYTADPDLPSRRCACIPGGTKALPWMRWRKRWMANS
jgi:SAM-dependent methyltransferase